MNPSQLSSDVLSHVRPNGHVIVPLGNGEPVALLDAIEHAAAEGAIDGVSVHQMHALRDRRYLHGELDRKSTRLNSSH